jgi:hypothetical protein
VHKSARKNSDYCVESYQCQIGTQLIIETWIVVWHRQTSGTHTHLKRALSSSKLENTFSNQKANLGDMPQQPLQPPPTPHSNKEMNITCFFSLYQN